MDHITSWILAACACGTLFTTLLGIFVVPMLRGLASELDKVKTSVTQIEATDRAGSETARKADERVTALHGRVHDLADTLHAMQLQLAFKGYYVPPGATAQDFHGRLTTSAGS
jgi:hypothetical protein